MKKADCEEQSIPHGPGLRQDDQRAPWLGSVQEPGSPAPTSKDSGFKSDSICKDGSTSHEDLYVQDISSQDPGYDGDVEVIKPYAIEEPDDPVTPEATRPVTPKLGSFADLVHDDLVDSMRDLDCNSDSNDARPRKTPKRGRKRKPACSLGASTHYHHQTATPSAAFGAHGGKSEGNMLSPKRLRRRSKRSKEGINVVPIATASFVSSDGQRDEASSTPTLSPAANGTESMADIEADDKMDVD